MKYKNTILSIEDEIATAIMNNSPVYDLHLSDGGVIGVQLPKPQTCGTHWQQLTYARMKAQQIMDFIRLFDEKVD